MFAELPSARLLQVLDRPDLRVVAADRRRVAFDPTLDAVFRVDAGGRVVLGGACLAVERICAFHLRHALELSLLLDRDGDRNAPDALMLAAFAAARVAARFWSLEAEPDAVPVVPWLDVMGSDSPPTAAVLATVWCCLRHLHDPVPRLSGSATAVVPAAVADGLAACWALLGPVEILMATGGDGRLAVDPRTGLNHYGCSHRPRPWAITFASSTASSLSERGFAGAEAARRRLVLAARDGHAARTLRTETERVRDAIALHWGLARGGRPNGDGVVLAASGTDLEMIALALCTLPAPGTLPERPGAAAPPISNLLVAPEETGTGVPLAAAGRHFAADTARGAAVPKGELVPGFPSDTRVIPVPIRDPSGQLLPPEEVDRNCALLAEREHALGRTVLVHRLDVSKTGVLAPGLDVLQALRDRLGERLEVVVDACQARLDPRRVRDYLRRGWMVMVTGSKFFTGPPFCGAILLPDRLSDRLAASGHALPPGLAEYGGAADWPAHAAPWDPAPNAGMLLRWQAALAEMRAFAAVPAAIVSERTGRFIAALDAAVTASPDVDAVSVPPPSRPPSSPATEPVPAEQAPAEQDWDRAQTIRSFLVLSPPSPGTGSAPRSPLAVPDARRVYRWLNADLSAALPPHCSPAERALARLLCHIGQPAPVADDRLPGIPAGALRISVGARLISGEPSHEGMNPGARLRREIADAERVLHKIGLILRHWDALCRHDPEPRFAAAETHAVDVPVEPAGPPRPIGRQPR